MVRGKLTLQLPKKTRRNNDVSHVPIAVHTLSERNVRDKYQGKLDQCLLDNPHMEGSSREAKWTTFKNCVAKIAEETLGRKRKSQPDWFSEASDTLIPLISAKRKAHNKFLQNSSVASKKDFRSCQRIVKSAVDDAKES